MSVRRKCPIPPSLQNPTVYTYYLHRNHKLITISSRAIVEINVVLCGLKRFSVYLPNRATNVHSQVTQPASDVAASALMPVGDPRNVCPTGNVRYPPPSKILPFILTIYIGITS